MNQILNMNWNLDDKIILQGLDESELLSSVKIMEDNGVNIIAGINVGHGGENNYNLPIFNLVEEAIAEFGTIETSIFIGNSHHVLDGILEAINSGIKQIIINSSGISPLDLLKILKQIKVNNVSILGSGNSGIIVPEKLCLGAIESKFYQLGEIAIINTGNWSLNYETALALNSHKMGQSIAINLGEDELLTSSIFSWLTMLNNHQETSIIVMIISDEKYISKQEMNVAIKDILPSIKKPIIAYISNDDKLKKLKVKNTKRMIADQVPFYFDKVISREEIIKVLKTVNVQIAKNILEIPLLIKSIAKVNDQ